MFKQISGSIGSIFASICCLGVAPVLAALSAAGLGFIISDAVLIPMLALFLGITLWGMKGSRAKHGNSKPLYLGSSGAIAALVGIFVFMPLHILGLVALIGASVWDIILLRKQPSTCETTT